MKKRKGYKIICYDRKSREQIYSCKNQKYSYNQCCLECDEECVWRCDLQIHECHSKVYKEVEED